MTFSFPKELPWAEARVLHGGPQRLFSFSRDCPAHHIVGSGPEASIRFEARGVAPQHFHLVWDGRNAWLEDPLRLGRTLVNAKPLNEWIPIVGRALVNFGTASMVLSGEGDAPVHATPDFDALERARLLESGTIRRSETLRVMLARAASSE